MSTIAAQPLRAALLLGGLILIAYGNSLGNGFVFDDLPLISHNRALADLHQLPDLFLRDYWAASRDDHEAAVTPASGLYRPVVTASYSLNAAVTGPAPFGFHLVNIGLHLLVTLLLSLVARQRGVPPAAALIGATIFSVHPLHTEAVTAVIGRAELLMSAGTLACVWFAGAGRPWLSCLALLGALFSKEQALVAPLLIAVTEWAGRTDRSTDRVKGPTGPSQPPNAWPRYAGYGLAILLYLAFRWTALNGFSPPPVDSLVNPAAATDTPTRIWTALKVAGLYLRLMVWPVDLSANYSFDSIALAASPGDPAVLLSGLLWSGLLLSALLGIRRRDPSLVFSTCLTLLTFLPVSNLLIPIGTIMGERLFYLPSAGLCLLAGMAADGLLRRMALLPHAAIWRLAVVSILALLTVASTARTIIRNGDWVDNEHLASSMLQVVPNNSMAHALLGYAKKSQRTPQALAAALLSYEEALRIYPGYTKLDPLFASHYGQLLFAAGRPDDAVRAFEDSLSTHRGWSTLHYNLGLAYAKTGRPDEAERHLRDALALNPADPDAHNVLSHVLLQQGRIAEGLASAERALSYAPDHEGARYYRSLALAQLRGHSPPDQGPQAP